jgi:formylglycine-generating enzyme required for sulfatase activity
MKKIIAAAILAGIPCGLYAADFDLPALRNIDMNVPYAGQEASAPKAWPFSEGRDGDIVWVPFKSGSFTMGTVEAIDHVDNTRPAHMVSVRRFELSKTEITVAQYAECVRAGKCKEPKMNTPKAGGCTWGIPGLENFPVNCVSWDQARKYASFKGARLPTEAEWEYAAKSGGQAKVYPWGDEAPAAGTLLVGKLDPYKCTLQPVCSIPAGNTLQGLCDMAGNVSEWVEDAYADSYASTPVNGGAFRSADTYNRVLRGGHYSGNEDWSFQTAARDYTLRGSQFSYYGFRIARTR